MIKAKYHMKTRPIIDPNWVKSKILRQLATDTERGPIDSFESNVNTVEMTEAAAEICGID